MKLIDRFLEKVSKSDGCWTWIGCCNDDGYGQIFVFGKSQRAHRVSYELFVGSITKDKFVYHSCDNRKCVNPEHLWLGTNKENMKDMVLKGRKIKAAARGERNGNVKVSDKIVLEIQKSDKPLRYFVAKYGLALSTVAYARNHRRKETYGKASS